MDTDDPLPVPNNPDNKMAIPCRKMAHVQHMYDDNKSLSLSVKRNKCARITCQPTPRLRIDGGVAVALAYLAAAMNPPVDCI